MLYCAIVFGATNPEGQDKESGLQGRGSYHSPLRLRDMSHLPQSYTFPRELSSALYPHRPQHSMEQAEIEISTSLASLRCH